MTKTKRIEQSRKRMPIRTCIACREKAEKKEMVRIVRTADMIVTVDETGKLRGRGANLCPKLKCFERAAKTKRFKTALNLTHSPSEAELEKMRKDFEQVLYKRKFRVGKKAVTLRVKKEDLHNLVEEK